MLVFLSTKEFWTFLPGMNVCHFNLLFFSFFTPIFLSSPSISLSQWLVLFAKSEGYVCVCVCMSGSHACILLQHRCTTEREGVNLDAHINAVSLWCFFFFIFFLWCCVVAFSVSPTTPLHCTPKEMKKKLVSSLHTNPIFCFCTCRGSKIGHASWR